MRVPSISFHLHTVLYDVVPARNLVPDPAPTTLGDVGPTLVLCFRVSDNYSYVESSVEAIKDHCDVGGWEFQLQSGESFAMASMTYMLVAGNACAEDAATACACVAAAPCAPYCVRDRPIHDEAGMASVAVIASSQQVPNIVLHDILDACV